MLDKDKIVKLVKLANNNSNENEANLAARKVCKILQDENWEELFTTQRSRNSFIPNPNKKYAPWTKADKNRTSDPIKDKGQYNPFGSNFYQPTQKQQEFYQSKEPFVYDEQAPIDQDIYKIMMDFMDQMKNRKDEPST